MEWKAVESSQIQAIGYAPDSDYPLGILFKPNKKQQAAGQPGAVYEYANVSPELFAAFLDSKNDPSCDFSVGKFFDQNIKSHPEMFPYRKAATEAA